MNFGSAIPLVAGLTKHLPNPPSTDTLGLVSGTYGVIQEVSQADPTGGFLEDVARCALTNALIFASIGYLVPGLTAVEGLKWGAITGGARAVYNHVQRG